MSQTLTPNIALKILRFYRNVEFYNPFDLKKLIETYEDSIIEVKSTSPIILPWENKELFNLDPEYEYNYDIYFSIFELSEIKNLLAKKLPEILNEGFNDQKFEDGQSCMMRIRVNAIGNILAYDTSISTLPWANQRFVESQELSMRSFDLYAEEILETLTQYSKEDHNLIPLNYHSLLKLVLEINNTIPISFNPNCIFCYINPHRMKKKKLGDDDIEAKVEEESTSDGDFIYRKVDILNSFYIRDLERVAEAIKQDNSFKFTSGPLQSYFQGMLDQAAERYDVIKDKKLIDNQSYAYGRWPNDVNLNLSQMQNFALNSYLLSSDKLHAVNGPPGTGKSFLIRDLIADLVIKRAVELSKFNRPEEVFENTQRETNLNSRNYRYRVLKEELSGFELLIASSNNNAVNNISMILPLKKSLGEDFKDLSYLKELAAKYFLSDEVGDDENLSVPEVWGLPSIALGKRSNRIKFISKVFFSPKEESDEVKSWRFENQILSFSEWRKVAPKNALCYAENRKLFLEALNLKDKNNLFIAALKFQESWLRETPRLEQEFLALAQFIKNPTNVESVDAKNFWRLLFMLTPVVSTTLASIEKQFKSTPSGTIGHVVIDEAGQALPQSVIGILQRVNKALILGDQRQLEPICILPNALIKILGEDLGQDLINFIAPNKSSVQSIADNQNKFGTYLSSNYLKVWIGTPLVEHRRCVEPMFSLSNKIAYDGIMEYHTGDNEYGCPLGDSGWYQVQGICTGKQWVPEQGTFCVKLLRVLLNDLDIMPDIFFISPFREVVSNLKIVISNLAKEIGLNKEYRRELVKRIGTVHTFQGKEADIVFFILGGDHSTIGACEWAGSKPNLVNVAITRAKKRLYVVGDKNVWHNKGFFSDLQKGLVEKQT